MASDRHRTDEIRRGISTEREQLAGALSDLRTDVRSVAKKIPAIAGGTLAASIALGAVVAAVKRRRGDD